MNQRFYFGIKWGNNIIVFWLIINVIKQEKKKMFTKRKGEKKKMRKLEIRKYTKKKIMYFIEYMSLNRASINETKMF